MEELPAPDVLFRRFLEDSKSYSGARARFQLLVTDLVSVQISAASEVSLPSGSDWGIDTYVGPLNERIAVWQSKFFIEWGKSQRNQIRDSFNEVMKKADEEGFDVAAWTLCVPSVLPPAEQKWFDGWSARMRRKHEGLVIELKNGVRLRRELMQPDAAWVRNLYFPKVSEGAAPVLVRIPKDLTPLEGALFVKQLQAAGHDETDAAKGFFFAAEAMARDVESRGVLSEISALNEVELEIHGAWESTFNSKKDDADDDGRIRGLVDSVTSAASSFAATPGLPLRPAHRRGLAHRLVEHTKAGWVLHWRGIASEHSGPAASQVVKEVLERDGGENDTSS